MIPEIVTVAVGPGKAWGLIPAPTVRRFNDAALQAQVDKVLAGLSKDKRAAELSVGFDEQGVQVVGVVKLDHGWTILGGVSWDKGSSWGGRVGVRWAG